MKRIPRMSILLLVIILGLTLSSSALSNPSLQEPPPPTEVRLSTEDDGRQIELKEGQLLVITLEANPSTGYGWEVKEVDENILRPVGEIEFEQESNLLGAPAKQIMRFQAVGAGQTALTLVYRRPWEEVVEPTKTFSIQVQTVGPFTGVGTTPITPTPSPPKSVPASAFPVADQPPLGLPSSFNWCPGGGGSCTPIKNQAACGSCWAFSTVGPFESKILIHDALTKDLSEQYLLSCNTDGWDCDGGWWAHDYHWWKTPPGQSGAGAVYETDFPYQADDTVACSPSLDHHEKIDSWAFVGPEYGIPSVAAIQQAIYDHGPVSVALCAGSAFQSYTTGVFETNESCFPYDTNHAVVLVGWDDTKGASGAWRLRNSWGTGWGESGYMWIGYGTSNVGYSANYIFYSELPNKLHLPLVMKNYSPPTPGWNTILSEDFEGSFPGSWSVDDNEPGYGEYYWGKRDCRPYEGSYSGWGVGGGADGASLGCGNNYPDYTEGWMVYGPFSLVGATAADLQFKLWLNTQSHYDGVCRMASTDGTNFSGYCTTGESPGWIDRTLDLGGYTGQSQVWVALIFDSNSSINKPEGGYVDNIVLRKYVAPGMPAPPVSGVEPLPEGAEIVETPATLILKP